MSKEILRPQNKPLAAQPAPVPLAHIVGEIDHVGKVWTPAQPAQQEPVAFTPPKKWRDSEIADGYRGIRWVTVDGVYGTPTQEDVVKYLGYTTPPQRKPLTVEQIEKCIEAADSKWADAFVSVEWARHLTKAIEAAHGIKETTK